MDEPGLEGSLQPWLPSSCKGPGSQSLSDNLTPVTAPYHLLQPYSPFSHLFQGGLLDVLASLTYTHTPQGPASMSFPVTNLDPLSPFLSSCQHQLYHLRASTHSTLCGLGTGFWTTPLSTIYL